MRDEVIYSNNLHLYHALISAYIEWIPDHMIKIERLATVLFNDMYTFKVMATAQEAMDLSFLSVAKETSGYNLTIEEYTYRVSNITFAEENVESCLMNSHLERYSTIYFNSEEDMTSPFADDMGPLSNLSSTYADWARNQASMRKDMLDYILQTSYPNVWNDILFHLLLYIISFLVQVSFLSASVARFSTMH